MPNLKNPFRRIKEIREELGLLPGRLGDILTTSKERRRLATDGIEAPFDKINWQGPFPGYKEQLCVLYINAPNVSQKALRDTRSDVRKPRFHIIWCGTLTKMYGEDRIQRYVLSTREVNKYPIRDKASGSHQEKWHEGVLLPVCRRCLGETGYDGYSSSLPEPEREKIVENFNLVKYFAENRWFFRYSVLRSYFEEDGIQVRKTYTKDWPMSSTRVRKGAGWTCEKCKVNLSGYHEGLHVHHINGAMWDNRPVNLAALCADCHFNVDRSHRPLRNYWSREIITEIRRLRKEQGISV